MNDVNVPEGYKSTDVGVIPEDWEVENITQSCKEIFLGLTAKVDYVKHGGIPLIRATDISNGKLSFQNALFISTQQHKQLTKYRKAKYRDVLVSKSGSLGVCALVDTKKEFSIYESIIVLQPISNKLNSNFLLSVLSFQKTQNRLLGGTVGSTVGHLNLNLFKQLNVPLPPLPEQKAIARVLSDVDELIRECDSLLAKKLDIKQGTMQQLLTGKQRLSGFTGEWEVFKVSSITVSHKQGFYTKDKYQDSGVSLVRITDLLNPKIDYASMPKLNVSNKDFELFKINKGDFLIARSGAIGRYGIVYKEAQQAIFGSYIIRFFFNSRKIINEYFGYFYETEEVIKQLTTITQGSSNININADNIKSIEIPLPPLPEQKAIAKILSDMDAEIEALEKKQDKYKAIKQGMMQELLTGKTRLVE